MNQLVPRYFQWASDGCFQPEGLRERSRRSSPRDLRNARPTKAPRRGADGSVTVAPAEFLAPFQGAGGIYRITGGLADSTPGYGLATLRVALNGPHPPKTARNQSIGVGFMPWKRNRAYMVERAKFFCRQLELQFWTRIGVMNLPSRSQGQSSESFRSSPRRWRAGKQQCSSKREWRFRSAWAEWSRLKPVHQPARQGFGQEDGFHRGQPAPLQGATYFPGRFLGRRSRTRLPQADLLRHLRCDRRECRLRVKDHD